MSSRRSLDELMTVAPPPPPPPLPHSPTPAMQETVACILDEPNPIIANLTTQNIAENVINNNNDDDVVVKSTDNLIELNNFNSNNSLNSDNFSSPMQTSCDIFMDSELISIDLTSSNDSESSKNNGNEQRKCETLRKNHGSSNGISKKKKMTAIYGSTETCSPAKSDRSLLNSDDGRPSDDDDDDDEDEGLFATTFNKRAINLNKKKRRNVQPKSCKYFGVKTLQNIFGKYEGYSDISSSSAGDFGGEPDADRAKPFETDGELIKLDDGGKASPDGCDDDEAIVAEPSDDGLSLSRQHFEDNVHAILSEMFAKKNFRPSLDLLSGHARSTTARNCQSRGSSGGGGVTATAMATTAAKKQLRIGKALRLCPNETALSESERKEKLLARYVYNANSIGTVDGVGDPDFGTPV